MMIRLTRDAVNTLNRVYTDRSIYNKYGHFANWFLKWNHIFHQYVRDTVLSTITRPYGIFPIGTIGSLTYFKYNVMGIDVFTIRNFHFPTFRFTSSSIPPVDVTKSPRNIWAPPHNEALALPRGTRILKGIHLNRFKLAYHNHKYTILNDDNSPFVEKWFDRKPKFFKKPFGKNHIIAHVSYHKSLFAIGVDGYMYDMHKLWDDAYLNEAFIVLLNLLITEEMNKCLHRNIIQESYNNVIRINEQQLYYIIHKVIDRLMA